MVKKRTLLLIAGIVWLLAGVNVARPGILAYLEMEQQWYWYLLSILIFLLFGTMFFMMRRPSFPSTAERKRPLRKSGARTAAASMPLTAMTGWSSVLKVNNKRRRAPLPPVKTAIFQRVHQRREQKFPKSKKASLRLNDSSGGFVCLLNGYHFSVGDTILRMSPDGGMRATVSKNSDI